MPLSIRSAGKRITEVLLSANVLRDENDAVSGVFVTARDITKLRCEVRLVDPGSLPNDGKVIEDLRAIG